VSPRNFAKHQLGPNFIYGEYYDRYNKPHSHLTFKEKVLRYTGITYVIGLFKSQEK